jgi:hypothetical protein
MVRVCHYRQHILFCHQGEYSLKLLVPEDFPERNTILYQRGLTSSQTTQTAQSSNAYSKNRNRLQLRTLNDFMFDPHFQPTSNLMMTQD